LFNSASLALRAERTLGEATGRERRKIKKKRSFLFKFFPPTAQEIASGEETAPHPNCDSQKEDSQKEGKKEALIGKEEKEREGKVVIEIGISQREKEEGEQSAQ
jgi:hypothetical protein